MTVTIRTSISPDEVLAHEIVGCIKWQLDLLQKHLQRGGSTRTPVPPETQAVLDLVRAGGGLPGIRLDDPGALDRTREIERPLVASSSHAQAAAAYFLGYRYLPLPPGFHVAKPPADAHEVAARELTKAPWLGRSPGDFPQLCEAVQALVRAGLLEYAREDSLVEAARGGAPAATVPGTSGTGGPARAAAAPPVIRLAESFRLANPEVQRGLAQARLDLAAQEVARRSVCEDLGRTLPHLSNQATKEILETAPNGATIKWVVYHGRTVVDWLGQDTSHISRVLKDKPDCRIQLMVVGPGALPELMEGAAPATFLDSARPGAAALRKLKLPASVSRRLDIRAYGTERGDGLLRGILVANPSGQLLACMMTNWRFERDRANYGEILRLSGESNIAMVLHERFDEVFRRSVPLRGLGIRVRWLWDQGLLRLFVLMLFGGLFVLAVRHLDKDQGANALWFVLGLVTLQVSRVWRTLVVLWRQSTWGAAAQELEARGGSQTTAPPGVK